MSSLDTSAVTTRGGVRQKAGTLPQKDTSVKLKIRQHDCASVPIIVPACTTKRYNNRYGHLYNLEPMQEVEESEALSSSNSTSRLPRGNPCLESLSSEVVERESSANYESFSEGQRAGEITSTSECNEARVTHSSEPRLSVKVSKNHCEKNPPPARPNTPQRRSASQPTTPRNRSEIQVALQRKASSQPSTPGSTSPVQHTHSLPASRSSLSRTRGSSPSKHIESDQLQPPSRTSVGGRPSRRASVGVVSYKEPSLITKMRRPN